MNSLKNINKFVALYDNERDFSFSHVHTYPQTKLFSPFGIGIKERTVRFNFGSFFGRSGSFLYKTIAPFDFEKVEYNEDLDIITLHSSFGFIIRLYDIKYETITNEFWDSFDNKTVLRKNSEICKSGKVRVNHTSLAYMELISESTDSLLYDLLKLKFETVNLFEDYSFDCLSKFFDIYAIEHTDGMNQIKTSKKDHKIQFMNSLWSSRYDKLLDKDVFFYSWNALF